MNEQLWYYLDTTDAQQGPITIPQLQELAAQGVVSPATSVWTAALGEQWIPASNVEGLFANFDPVAIVDAAKEPISAVTSQVALSSPSELAETVRGHVAETPEVVGEPLQPPLAPTTPMIASTPTTQPITGVPAPSGIAAPIAAAAGVSGVYGVQQEMTQPAVAAAENTQEEAKKGKCPMGLILLLVGLVAAGAGGWFMYDKGNTTLSISLLAGGGVLALLGLILMLKGGKSSSSAALTTPALDGVTVGGGALAGFGAASAAAAPAPLHAGVVSASPLASPKISPVKANPLLPNPEAVRPANRLNTALPTKPAEPAEPKS